MERGSRDGDESAHAVTHDDWRAVDATGMCDGHDLFGPFADRVLSPVVTVAVTGQVEGHDAEVTGEPRRDVRPPVCVGATPVDEDEAAPAGLTPRDEVDVGAGDGNLAVGERDGQRVGEPRRCIAINGNGLGHGPHERRGTGAHATLALRAKSEEGPSVGEFAGASGCDRGGPPAPDAPPASRGGRRGCAGDRADRRRRVQGRRRQHEDGVDAHDGGHELDHHHGTAPVSRGQALCTAR